MEDWTQPKERAALEFVHRRLFSGPYKGGRYAFNDFDAARAVLMSREMFSYSQLRRWVTEPPAGAPVTFSLGAKALKEILDLGFNEERNVWWYVADVPQKELLGRFLLIADFGFMCQQLSKQNSFVVAPSFRLFFDLILGRGWETRYQRVIASARERLDAAKTER